MSKIWTWIARDWLVVLTLGLIFALGLFVRLYRLPDFTAWQDSARDFMVGEKFLKTQEHFLISPLAAGSAGKLNNSPAYYYLMAMLVKLFPDPLLIAGLVAILGSLTIIVNFFLGKKIGNDNTGLIAAFFTAISFALIVQSNSVVQPNLMPFFVSLFVLVLTTALEKKSFFWTLVGTFFFWGFFHLHYSIFLVAPVFIAGLMFSTWRLKSSTWFWQKVGYLAVVFGIGGWWWFVLTNRKTSFDLGNFFWSEFQGVGKGWGLLEVTTKLVGSYQQFISYYWWSIDTALALLVLVGVGVAFTVFVRKKLIHQQPIFLELILGGVFLSVGLTALFSRTVFDAYFIIQFTLMPLLLTQVVWLVASWRKLLALAVALWLAGWLNMGNERLAYPQIGPFADAKKVASLIKVDMSAKNLTSLNQVFIASKNRNIPTYHWSSPKYFYFLEHDFGQDNTSVVGGFNNLVWDSQNADYFYLICEEFESTDEVTVIAECVQPYLEKYHSIFVGDFVELPDRETMEKVFVLRVKPDAITNYYWPYYFSPKNQGK